MSANQILSKIGRLSSFLSNLGSVALFAMMAITVIDVIGRYIFNTPVLGAFELTEFLVLILIFSFLAYTQAQKRHICVEIIADLLPRKVQFLCNIINNTVCLIIFAMISYMSVIKALELMQTGETSPNLVIPNYPFVFFITLGSLVMCIEYVKDLVGLFLDREEAHHEP